MVPVSVLLAIGAWLTVPEPMPFLLAAAVYVVGAFGVTLRCNVPLNEALAALDVNTHDGTRYWLTTYIPNWTFWNGVRTGACLAAAALLLVAIT
jgi:uncharacterized membrane protein